MSKSVEVQEEKLHDGRKVSYFINRAKGTVVAISNFNPAKDCRDESVMGFIYDAQRAQAIQIPRTIRGIAKYRRPEDREITADEDFDLEFGKRLAFKKMMKSYYSKHLAMMHQVAELKMKELATINGSIEKLYKKFNLAEKGVDDCIAAKYPI